MVQAASRPTTVAARRGQRTLQFVDEAMGTVAEYDEADVAGWRVMPDSPDAVEVVIFIIVEIESRRKEKATGTPMTDDEKAERRDDSGTRSMAQKIVDGVSAGAAAGAGQSAITGLLSLFQ